MSYTEIEKIAENLHKEFRATDKALGDHTGGFSEPHDHGWKDCDKKEYFRRRAKRWVRRFAKAYQAA